LLKNYESTSKTPHAVVLEGDFFLHSNKRCFIIMHALYYSSSVTRCWKRNTKSAFNNKFIL